MSKLTESLVDFNIYRINEELKELMETLTQNVIVDQCPPREYESIYDEIKELTDARQKMYDIKHGYV